MNRYDDPVIRQRAEIAARTALRWMRDKQQRGEGGDA